MQSGDFLARSYSLHEISDCSGAGLWLCLQDEVRTIQANLADIAASLGQSFCSAVCDQAILLRP